MDFKYTNTTQDGEVTGKNPDAVSDYFQITDYNRDKNYFNQKIVQALMILSTNSTTEFQILYGGVVSDAGSGQINISAGAAIGRDASGNARIIAIPALSNVSLPVGWNDTRQIWVIGKYVEKLSTETRTHFIGESYHYISQDSYLGESLSTDLFVDADPGANIVKWGSFSMNGTSYTEISDRTGVFTFNTDIVKIQYGLNGLSLIDNGTSFPKVLPGMIEVNGKNVQSNVIHTFSLTNDKVGVSATSIKNYKHYHGGIDQNGNFRVFLAAGDLISSTAFSSISVTGGTATMTHTAFSIAPIAGDVIFLDDGIFYGNFTIDSITDTTHLVFTCSADNGTYATGGTVYAHYDASNVQGSTDGTTKSHYTFTDATASKYSPTPILNTNGTGYYFERSGRPLSTATAIRAFSFMITGSGTVTEWHTYGNNDDKNDNIIITGEGSNQTFSALYKYSTSATTITLYSYKFVTPLKLWGTDYTYIITATDSYVQIINPLSVDIDCSKLYSATAVNNNYIGINDRAYCGASCGTGTAGYSESNPMSHTEKLKVGDKIRILQSNNYAPAQAVRESLAINMSRI